MTESILKRLKKHGVLYVEREGSSFFTQGRLAIYLTRDELIQLADEIRELAGEDFDHG